MPPKEPPLCHRCGALLQPGEGRFWIVRIDAVCDPAPPALDPDESPGEIAAEWGRLIEALRSRSEQELLDEVYRRLTLTLCAACFRLWIERPVE
jgi:hypothetical protein